MLELMRRGLLNEFGAIYRYQEQLEKIGDPEVRRLLIQVRDQELGHLDKVVRAVSDVLASSEKTSEKPVSREEFTRMILTNVAAEAAFESLYSEFLLEVRDKNVREKLMFVLKQTREHERKFRELAEKIEKNSR